MDKMNELITRLDKTHASLVVLYTNGEIKEYYNKRAIDAASLLAISGVKKLYAGKLSKFVLPVLEEYNVEYTYGEIIPYVINNDKTGMCPMENRFSKETNIQVIYDYFINN